MADAPGDDAVRRMIAMGLLSDISSAGGERIAQARDIAREMGADEQAVAELVQAYARGTARIVAAEAEVGRRTVSPTPASTYDARVREWIAVVRDLGAEVFDSLHGEQLAAAMRRVPLTPAADDGTVACVDLRGSTDFMLTCAPVELRELLDELFYLAQRIAHAYRVTVVKHLGDGVVLLSRDPDAALATAIDLVTELGKETQLLAGAGIASGRVLSHAGDCFGPAVNLASRLAEAAAANEVLVDRDGWTACRGGYEARTTRVRGMDDPRVVMAFRVQ
jgi:class 3 adenylate cyclase